MSIRYASNEAPYPEPGIVSVRQGTEGVSNQYAKNTHRYPDYHGVRYGNPSVITGIAALVATLVAGHTRVFGLYPD